MHFVGFVPCPRNDDVTLKSQPSCCAARRTRDEQRRWRGADTKMIVAALDRAEERVTQVINAERDAFADFMRADNSNSPPPEGRTG